MNHEKLMKIILTLLQFVGLCPISHNIQTYTNNILIEIWTLCCVFLIVPHTVYLFTLIYTDVAANRYACDRLDFFIAISKAIMIVVTHFITIFESLFTRYNQWSIWNNFVRFYELFDEIDEPIETVLHKFIRKYFWKVALYQLLSFSIELCFVWRFLTEIGMIKYWYATTISLMITRIRLCQEIMYIDMLTMGYTVIGDRLGDILELNEKRIQLSANIDMLNVEKKFKTITSAYVLLYKILNNFKIMTGASQLANLTLNFVQITGDSYWLYNEIHSGSIGNAIGTN